MTHMPAAGPALPAIVASALAALRDHPEDPLAVAGAFGPVAEVGRGEPPVHVLVDQVVAVPGAAMAQVIRSDAGFDVVLDLVDVGGRVEELIGAFGPSDPDYGFRGESIFTWSLEDDASLVAYADDGSLVRRVVVRLGRR